MTNEMATCNHLETRCGRLAETKINCRSIEKYVVVKFVAKHTHVLVSPHKHMFLKSQRTINPKPAVDAELANSSGIVPKVSIGLMARDKKNKEIKRETN